MVFVDDDKIAGVLEFFIPDTPDVLLRDKVAWDARVVVIGILATTECKVPPEFMTSVDVATPFATGPLRDEMTGTFVRFDEDSG